MAPTLGSIARGVALSRRRRYRRDVDCDLPAEYAMVMPSGEIAGCDVICSPGGNAIDMRSVGWSDAEGFASQAADAAASATATSATGKSHDVLRPACGGPMTPEGGPSRSFNTNRASPISRKRCLGSFTRHL